MSDEEYDYDYGSDAEYNYGSENGSEHEDGDDELIEIENAYYEGDDLKINNPRDAIKLFEKVVDLETNRGDEVKWRFKALQNLVTAYYSLGENEKMIDRYRTMLVYMSKVTRNECTDAINIILDTLQSAQSFDSLDLSEMYKITLEALKKANNERLWFTTNLKLAKVYLDIKNYGELENLLVQLKNSCQLPDGTDDITKGTYLLEVYCLEIQLCTLTQNSNRMRAIYPRTLNLNAAVSDPRIMGIIREEGGKMYLLEGQWLEAYNELFEAFRAYQQAGNTRAKICLKYVVLASMLALSDINPFSAREAKVYADDAEIIAMSDLRNCLEVNDLKKFEKIIKDKRNKICDEPLLMTYIGSLRNRMREHVLLSICKPFKKVTLTHLGESLSLTSQEVESLLIGLILDEKLTGAYIDQMNGILVMNDLEIGDSTTIRSIQKYAEAEKSLCASFPNRNVM